MFEIIIALLEAKFQGMRKDGLKNLARVLALQVTTEDAAKEAVNKLTDAQVNQFVKDFRADVDKEITESNNTFKTNLEKKYNLVEKTEPGGNGNQGGNENQDDLESKIAAAVAKANQPLLDRLNAYAAKDVADNRLKLLNEKLSGCKDETFKAQTLKDFARMQFKDDDEFNAYLAEKETDIATANQNVANQNLGNQGSPMFAQKEESGVSSAVASFIDSNKPDATSSFTGKEV